ncbi:dna-binding wrky domain-containing protein [Diplodia corticola]|uniref:Dna-binding wrky domain-containing protein n=1 Tax=Diplodia corticola TaxID=236234 RepID=A0A1J9RQI0_9PEZI|nr:dna-binding wrky domain-containing protein [Diplodia corticola]OJD34803.1 dna-binding wrky domain-containing protein [Diplodia corticola]
MSSPVFGDTGTARSSVPFSQLVVVLAVASAISLFQNITPKVVAASYSICATLWLFRLVSRDATAIVDSFTLVVLSEFGDLSLITKVFELTSGYVITTLAAIFSAFLIVTVLRSALLFRSSDSEHGIQAEFQAPGKCYRPLLFPCRTTHTRMFPKKHSFAYSYLLVGVPVGPEENDHLNTSMISVDAESSSGASRTKGWFHIRGSDYLERGGENVSLKAKLTQYLQSQGISDGEWHHAYLVTAAKFLGYSFNPVSFWYIYSASHQLVMMILEVNNTFGERRMYLLKGSSHDVGDLCDENGTTGHAKQATKFTDAWVKDFHVSPFNSRKGSYSLTAVDPFNTVQGVSPRIDNNIVLRSSKQHPKLVARVFSDGAPQDPNRLSIRQALYFIGNWWWVGLVTFPRIVKEAYKLYFWRSLEVFFRPEVVPTSIGRDSTTIERHLESFFRRYLDYLVSRTDQSVRVSYTPAPGLGEPHEFFSSSAKEDQSSKSLEINVTSPAFYSRFVHYYHTSEALDRESLFADEKNKTAWISNPQALKLLPLNRPRYVEPPQLKFSRARSAIGWHLLRRLRCPPAAPSYPASVQGSDPAFVREDIRPKGFATCDEYVMRNCHDAWLYKRCLLKLFLAQRFGLGFTEMVDLLDLIVRVCLIVGVLSVVSSDLQARGAEDAGSAVPKILGLNTVHAWSLIKEAI